MAEIFHADYSKSSLEKLYKQKLNNGDLLGALLLTSTMKNNGFKEVDLCLKRARIYYDMCRYGRAAEEWFKYLSLQSDERTYARAYNGLGACFYRLGDNDIAGYYFHEQLTLTRSPDFDYCDVTLEYYDEVLNNKNFYKIAYPYEKADFSSLISSCDYKMKIGDYDWCLKNLAIIPEGSSFYVDKIVLESICYFMLGEPKKALELCDEAYKLQPDSISILCNAVSMSLTSNNVERADYYFNKIDFNALTIPDDIYKVLLVCCERGEHTTVKNLSIKYLKQKPYSVTIRYFYGIAAYNLGEYSVAEEAFKKCFQISSSPVHYYYYQVAERAVKGSVEFTSFEYNVGVPKKIKRAFLKQATKLLNVPPEERIEHEKSILTLAHYACYSGSYELQSSVATLLGELNTEPALQIMKDALLRLDIYDEARLGIIGYMVLNGFNEEVSLIIGNRFIKTTLLKAEFGEINHKVFMEAYSYAVTKMLPKCSDLTFLKENAEEIYNKFAKKGILDAITCVKSLAAVMFEYVECTEFKSRREFAKYFGASLKNIKQIERLLEE